MVDAPTLPSPLRRQWRLIGVAFGGATLLLAVGYWLFLQPSYVVLAQDLRPAAAAAIVAELDKRGTAHRLRDDGATILVPADQADATRLAISGIEITGAQTGFELFNKSDIGLTNFAQKINYQRALQGELVRTLMQMEGIQTARVHLAIPERALFRGDRSEPTAAVTITMRMGQTLTPDRVVGIQRLVAASVPDLPEGHVVVLDGDGRVVSATPQRDETSSANRSPDADERDAVARYYQARARRAIEARMPGLKLLVRALPLQLPNAAASTPDWIPAGVGSERNFVVRMIIISPTRLNVDDQRAIGDAVQQAVALDIDRGDAIEFQQGPVEPMPGSAPPLPPTSVTAMASSQPAAPSASAAVPEARWRYWPLLALLLVPLGVLVLRGRSPATLGFAAHQSFAERLRRQLEPEADDVAA